MNRGHVVAFACHYPETGEYAQVCPTPQLGRHAHQKNTGQFLGYVEAPDRAAADLAAVRAFNLSGEQRKRLLVRERG